ncbi:MAG: glucose-6-phosphate dehydrogenase assembly protein OpcA [Bryobacterales bacterium]|nr:glucose-6-phosphate dehydrogenase assembly protein OpcA [Bryobacterales bacterium]
MNATREVVQPEKLLTQLESLWTEFGKSGDSAENGLLRACSLTWITVVEGDDASVTEVDAMLADVMRMNPARAIVVLLRQGDERGLKGSVSAQCWRPFGSKQQVCIERVLLDTTRAGACDLPAVIRALIVADLPTVMFCRNAHLLTVPGIKEASGLTDRVVVDMAWHGAECRDVWPRMPEFGNLVSDLAWDRIRGYRGAMAQYFDTPANRELLKDLRAVRVATRPERPAPEAAYLLAWILGSLGYQRANGFEWRKADATVRAGFRAMRGDEPNPADSRIHLVDFIGARETLRFTVAARELSIAETEDASEIVVPVPAFEPDTALLSDEMMVERRRRTFEQHLGATIRLFEEPVYFADEQPH